MTRTVIRTAWTNARSRPLQTSLTAFIVLCAAAALTLALNVRAGADEPFERNFQVTDAAHAYVLTSEGSRASLERAARLPGVERSAGPYDTVDVSAVVGGSDQDISLVGMTELPPFDRPHVTSGRWVRPGAREVVVEHSFARQHELTVGDSLPIPRPNDTTVNLAVVGVAVTAAQGPSENWAPSFAWMPEDTFRALVPERLRGERLAVQLADRADSPDYLRRAESLYPQGDVLAYDWQHVRESVTERTQNVAAILQAASLTALLAVGFIIANAITGRVLAQRREIGILKAIGFTPRGVTAVVLTEQVVVAAVAALVGTAIGALVSPLLLRPTARVLDTPTPNPLEAGTILIAFGGIVLVVAVFTLLPAWRAGRLAPARAIAGARSSRHSKRSRLARAAARLHLPAPVVLGVKDVFGRRGRALLTIGSLALTMSMISGALSAEATFKNVIDDPSLRAKPYDMIIDPGVLSDAEMRRLLREQGSPIANTYTFAYGTGFADDGQAIRTRALGGNWRDFHYAVRDGREVAGRGEAIVGRGVLDDLGLEIGDDLNLSIDGREVTLRIVGRHVEPDDDGHVAIFPVESLPPALAAQAADDFQYALDVAPGADQHELARALEAGSAGRVNAEVTSDEVEQERADLRPVLFGVDAILLGIGLVNLLTTLLLSVRERSRDYGVFKVLGLTPRQVLASVSSGGMLLALLGLAIGTPLGIAVFNGMIKALSPSDGPDIVTLPPLWWIVLVIPGALLLTTLASILPARRAAALKPAQVLRYE